MTQSQNRAHSCARSGHHHRLGPPGFDGLITSGTRRSNPAATMAVDALSAFHQLADRIDRLSGLARRSGSRKCVGMLALTRPMSMGA